MKRIDAFLASYGVSVATLSAARGKQLEKVDEAIQHRLAAVEEAQNVLRKNSINVSTISSDTGISRKTFYNNELLRLYVEQYASTSRDDVLVQKEAACDTLRQKNDALTQQVQKFVIRDIETENLRQENVALTEENKRLTARITSLEEQFEGVQAQLMAIREKSPPENGKIITFSHA